MVMGLRSRRTRGAGVEYGPSLAKGPALIVGTILVVFGLAGLLVNADFPQASSSFPDGTAQGSSWLGFEVNGWTNFVCIAAGALLLFGAAQHHLAKLMSLVVGIGLGVCAVAAFIDGTDVFGLAAANGLTKLGMGVAAVVLLLNAVMPRVTRERPVAAADGTADDDRRRGRFLRRDRTATGRADTPETADTADRESGAVSSPAPPRR
jgi:hypothetical protein